MDRNAARNVRMVTLYIAGWTASEIAREFQCTRNVVAGALHRAGAQRGIVRRDSGGRATAPPKPTKANALNALRDPRDLEDLTILRCWDDGWSAGEIAGALRMTRNVVIGRLDRIFKASDPGDISRPWAEENPRLHPASF